MFRFALLWLTGLSALFSVRPAAGADQERPNILWISAEDISPDLGCYGDPYAITPHLDEFAKSAVRYTRCFSHAGVCAPARSGLITGCYPPAIGTQHMRCQGVPPTGVVCFPEYLRAAGYYCTNNSKTDYQFATPVTAWDESSNKADWHGRAKDQPFFCVLNFTTTHESQIRDPGAQTQKLVAALPPELRHDPAKAIVPPYYPDTPGVRTDLASYADNLTALDQQVANVLQRLEDDGLADNTIVWFWGDHGRGLPRCKRWLYDSGTQVPLLIRVPEKWRSAMSPGNPEAVAPGAVNDDLVAFVDFAPTVLSLAGIAPAPWFQGQAFLGPKRAEKSRDYVYGHRDRMDEAFDLIRMVRDKRFKYLRNFMPDVSYAQDINYMNQMPTMQELRRLHAASQLSPEAELFFQPTKPVEELFDTGADPHELRNLANDPAYAGELARMRAECRRWMMSSGDAGLIHEAIFDELKRPGGVMQQTAAPVLQQRSQSDQSETYAVISQWPGVSLAYAIVPRESRARSQPQWQFSGNGEQISLKPGEILLAKGCRLGFQDSDVTRQPFGEPPEEITVQPMPQHWRQVVDADDLLERLWQIKSYDGRRDAEALSAYTLALKDPSPAVRYWGLRGANNIISPEQWTETWQETAKLLQETDPSPAVQVLAAGIRAQRQLDAATLRFLARELNDAVQPSVQLTAAHALQTLGEAARPVLPEIRKATSGSEYPSRVAKSIVSALERN